MNEVITIKTEKGILEIRLEQFFPTTQKRVRQLRKVMTLDWKNERETLRIIQEWLEHERVTCLTFGTANIPKADKLKKNLDWLLT